MRHKGELGGLLLLNLLNPITNRIYDIALRFHEYRNAPERELGIASIFRIMMQFMNVLPGKQGVGTEATMLDNYGSIQYTVVPVLSAGILYRTVTVLSETDFKFIRCFYCDPKSNMCQLFPLAFMKSLLTTDSSKCNVEHRRFENPTIVMVLLALYIIVW